MRTYDYSEGGAYFVTICAKDKRKLFGEIVGGGAFDAPQIRLSAVGQIVNKYIQSTNNIPKITVDNYVIMPNHVHLLISSGKEKGASWAPPPTDSNVESTLGLNRSRPNQLLPHTIATLKRFINRDVGYNVFQRSFHDHIVRSKQDYREIWQYMDENPYKWQEDCFFVTG